MSEKKRDRNSEQTPEAKARKKEYDRQYRLKNKDKINRRVLNWKHENPERNKELNTRYVRKKFGPKKVRDWRTIIQKIKEQLDNVFTPKKIKPTLRTMHYRLYSLGIIHNTKYDYQKLSSTTATSREYDIGIGFKKNKKTGEYDVHYYPILPIESFVDDSRSATRPTYTQLNYHDPEYYIDDHIDDLKNITSYYQGTVSRWLNQPHYVEIWVEKKAMVGTFESIIEDRQVSIVPFGGYHSVSYLYKNVNTLKEYHRRKKKIHILYFGDFDPTGKKIEEVLRQKISDYGMNIQDNEDQIDDINYIDFRRIGVTKQQMEEFGLPPDVDPETEKKLEDDKNTPAFIEKYGKVYQIEVDSLPAYEPEKFKNMVLEPIDRYFDEDIYEEVLNEHSDDELDNLVSERVTFLDDETS